MRIRCAIQSDFAVTGHLPQQAFLKIEFRMIELQRLMTNHPKRTMHFPTPCDKSLAQKNKTLNLKLTTKMQNKIQQAQQLVHK